MSQNVGSLNAKFKKLSDFVGDNNLGSEKCVIARQEVWHNKKNFLMEGFHPLISSTRIDQEGGGLGLYISKLLHFEVCYQETKIVKGNYESQMVKIKIDNFHEIYILNLYRPPKGSIENFIENLTNQLCNLNETKRPFIICGDTNLNLYDEKNGSIRKYQDLLVDHCLYQLVKSPTRVTRTSSTLIDHVAVSAELYSTILNTKVIDTGISDHHTITTDLSIKKKKRKNTTKVLNIHNIKKLKENLSYYPWDSWCYSNLRCTVSESYDNLLEILQTEIDRTCTVLLDRKQHSKPKNPWMSQELLQFSKKYHTLQKKIKNGKTADLMKIKNIKRELQRKIRNAKRDYYTTKFNQSSNNPKEMWKNINEVLGCEKGVKFFLQKCTLKMKKLTKSHYRKNSITFL